MFNVLVVDLEKSVMDKSKSELEKCISELYRNYYDKNKKIIDKDKTMTIYFLGTNPLIKNYKFLKDLVEDFYEYTDQKVHVKILSEEDLFLKLSWFQKRKMIKLLKQTVSIPSLKIYYIMKINHLDAFLKCIDFAKGILSKIKKSRFYIMPTFAEKTSIPTYWEKTKENELQYNVTPAFKNYEELRQLYKEQLKEIIKGLSFEDSIDFLKMSVTIVESLRFDTVDYYSLTSGEEVAEDSYMRDHFETSIISCCEIFSKVHCIMNDIIKEKEDKLAEIEESAVPLPN